MIVLSQNQNKHDVNNHFQSHYNKKRSVIRDSDCEKRGWSLQKRTGAKRDNGNLYDRVKGDENDSREA